MTHAPRAPARGHALLGVLVALAVSGCAGSGEGLDANGRPVGETPSSPPPGRPVDFATLQSSIFTPLCTACHAGGAAPLGLRLEAGISFAMLVNVPSVQVPNLLRVAPGNADSSYLVHKIEGRAAVGERMPLGGPALSQTSIEAIRQWISQGAPPPSAPLTSTAPMTVIASAPIDAEEVLAEIDRLLIVFARAPDVSLLNSTTVTLHQLGGAAADAVAFDRQIPLSEIRVPVGAPMSAWIVPRAPLRAGEYVLRLRASGPAALADVAGNLLDGDGDGVAGGDYELGFTVQEPPP